MKRTLTLTLLWIVVCGAFYEWGGPARTGVRELRQKQYDEALRDLGKGRADFPGQSVIPYNEGLAHLGRGAADSAAARFQEATRLRGLGPHEAASYNLGNLAMRAKDYASASQFYRDALRIRPGDQDAKRNLEEAIRHMRQPQQQDSKSPPSGGQGPPTPPGNQRQEPNPQARMNSTPPPRGSSGAFTKDEAERWLEALESERRAKRQEGKGRASQENGNRDW